MNQQFIDELTELIEVKTPSYDFKSLHQILEKCKQKISKTKSITIESFEKDGIPSLLAYNSKSRPKKFKIILNGHLDVVPAKLDQYKVNIDGNLLYGRGSIDMKSAALVLMNVFCELAPKLPYSIALQLVTDEETGGMFGTGHQVEMGVDADFVLGGDITNMTLDYQSKGICNATVEVQGHNAHSAYLWRGKNAILKLMAGIDSLLTAYPIPSSEDWVTTANISQISTRNKVLNKVPDNAKVALDIRFVQNDPNFSSFESTQNYLEAVFPESTVSIDQFQPGVYCPPDNPQIQKLVQSYKDITGQDITLVRRHGSSDMRFYTYKGIPCVSFGPKGNDHHGDNEYLELDSIEPYYQTIKKFLLDTHDK